MAQFSPTLYEREGREGERRREVVAVLEAALQAVDPYAAVQRYLRRDGHSLWVDDRAYDLDDYDRVLLVGAGKAGAPMAQAVEAVLGDWLSAGCVTVKDGYTLPTRCVELTEASHPIPNEAGVEGATKIARLLDTAGERDLVLCVISGGGSALMTLPVDGVTLDDMQALTGSLLRAGATINEINAIRKHLDRVKGGGLARMANPARIVSLMLSDVVGNPLDVIASGPAVPDTSTYEDALALLEHYGLLDETPSAILQHLRRGAAGEVPDTPKPGDPIFAKTQNVVVASNDLAARAAEDAAQALGFNTLLLTTYVEGEAREVSKVFAALAKETLASGRPVARPACLIAGGETTVTIRGTGSGGRNQEMALMAAIQIAGLDDVAIVCLATDGTDGPTDASGAMADGATLDRASALGLDAWAHLRNNDSYNYFKPIGDLLLTGPTNTNVNDLTFVFVW